jgi:hypothetical protein
LRIPLFAVSDARMALVAAVESADLSLIAAIFPQRTNGRKV